MALHPASRRFTTRAPARTPLRAARRRSAIWCNAYANWASNPNGPLGTANKLAEPKGAGEELATEIVIRCLPPRAGRPQDAVPNHPGHGPQRHRTGTMDHAVEARIERFRLRRPHAGAGTSRDERGTRFIGSPRSIRDQSCPAALGPASVFDSSRPLASGPRTCRRKCKSSSVLKDRKRPPESWCIPEKA